MGRCVYTGIFEPGSSHGRPQPASAATCSTWCASWASTLVRYPGGNFVSNYRWEDGVGPVEDRPRRLDLAWRSLESNAFGVDEFAAWCEAGRGRADDGGQPRHPRGRRRPSTCSSTATIPRAPRCSDLRRANGTKEPHDIRVWCLGNEMDGPWQIGHKTAARVRPARRRDRPGHAPARPAHRAGRRAGAPTPGCRRSPAGRRPCSSSATTPVDHVSLHNYYDPTVADLPAASWPAASTSIGFDRRRSSSTADHVGARGSRRRQVGSGSPSTSGTSGTSPGSTARPRSSGPSDAS